jgi:hypothetical protein
VKSKAHGNDANNFHEERGIYAASLFKVIWALKRAKARAPLAKGENAC